MEASKQLIAAKTRYAKAQSAVENLNADIQPKQKFQQMRVPEWIKAVLSDLKAEKATDSRTQKYIK